jgi:NADH dehydrogenase
MLATIGRAKAVAQIGRIHLSGLIAWLLWCVVHIFFLIGLRNRVRVISEWMWYFVTFKPGARVIYDLPKSTCEELKTSQAGSAGQDRKE